MSSFFGIKEACSQAFQLYVRHALSHFNMSALPTNWHISILLVSEWSCFEHVASRMTANALFLKSGWITANAPLRNGVGRFIPQLARVTLKFCKAHGDSNGVKWNQFVFWVGEIESYHFEPGTHNYWVQHLGCLVWTLFSIAGELPKKSAALSQARLKSSSPCSDHSTLIFQVRQFIQQDVVQWAKKNPSTVVYLKPRRHRCDQNPTPTPAQGDI